MKPDYRPEDVTAAIVTYGARQSLLLSVLERLRAEGVGQCVVVDNGAHWPVAKDLRAQFGAWVRVVPMGGNTGSSQGFAAALAAARDTGLPLIWLLDDDNRPKHGCLAELLLAYAEESQDIPEDMLALVAGRAEHSIGSISDRQLLTRWDSFGGFHVADLPAKLANRLPLRRQTAPTRRARVGVTHFGGMLFHRSLIERFGLPRHEFYMYADDTEFTWRITAAGGRIVEVADAVVEDLEPAAQETARLRNRFVAALQTDSDFRSYYATRNLAFFESRFRRRNAFLFALNRRIYFALLRRYAVKLGRMEKYRFLRASVSDGLAGRQGPDPRFPLG